MLENALAERSPTNLCALLEGGLRPIERAFRLADLRGVGGTVALLSLQRFASRPADSACFLAETKQAQIVACDGQLEAAAGA
jgi:hypothetical protein